MSSNDEFTAQDFDQEETVENSKEEVEEPKEEEVSEKETSREKEVETKTEKGTKLDPDPLSAVNQQLANAQKQIEQYERVLSNPELLNQFAQQQFNNTNQDQQPEIKEYKAEDFESLDDVAKVVNSLQKDMYEKVSSYRKEIEELKQAYSNLATQYTAKTVADRITNEVNEIQKLPEFDPKSPDYIEGLQEKVVERFTSLDMDPQTGMFRGKVSIADIAKEAIEMAKMGKKLGSAKAQTEVKNKTAGRVRTSPKVSVDDADREDDLPPADSIAAGIKRLGLGRGI